MILKKKQKQLTIEIFGDFQFHFKINNTKISICDILLFSLDLEFCGF